MIRKVRNYLGRVMRDIERACPATPLLRGVFEIELAKAKNGHDKCLKLVVDDPDSALKNADSYEYFI